MGLRRALGGPFFGRVGLLGLGGVSCYYGVGDVPYGHLFA